MKKGGAESGEDVENDDEVSMKNYHMNEQFLDVDGLDEEKGKEIWNEELRGRQKEQCFQDTYPYTEYENVIHGIRGTGRGDGGSLTGLPARPGGDRSRNPTYSRRTIENLDTTTKNEGFKAQNVTFYGSFFAKIGNKKHDTDFSGKGGPEGLSFVESLDPEVYIPKALRGRKNEAYTDEQGQIQGFQYTREGYEAIVTNPRLAAEKNAGIYVKAFKENQIEERPKRIEMFTDMILNKPVIEVKTTDGTTIEHALQPKHRMFGGRFTGEKGDRGEEIIKDPKDGKIIQTINAEEVTRAAVQPVAKVFCKILEEAQHNNFNERMITTVETMQNQIALLERKVNFNDAKNYISHKNRPTWKEMNAIVKSESQARFNLVVRVSSNKYNQLKGTTSMEAWKKMIIGWFKDVNNSIYHTLEIENLRAVWFSRDSKSDEFIPIILTWDTEDRARMIMEEYRSIGKPVIKEKKPYKGSNLEGVDLKLGKIMAYKSKREQMQEDEFYETTRHTNSKNAKVLKDIKEGTYEDTRKRIMKGEWKDMPNRIYTTKRGNESYGPTTILQEWDRFKTWGSEGDKEKEWKTMVVQQIQYLDAGLKRGAVKGESREVQDWLPEPMQNRKKYTN